MRPGQETKTFSCWKKIACSKTFIHHFPSLPDYFSSFASLELLCKVWDAFLAFSATESLLTEKKKKSKCRSDSIIFEDKCCFSIRLSVASPSLCCRTERETESNTDSLFQNSLKCAQIKKKSMCPWAWFQNWSSLWRKRIPMRTHCKLKLI